jgi:hypothetical protein
MFVKLLYHSHVAPVVQRRPHILSPLDIHSAGRRPASDYVRSRHRHCASSLFCRSFFYPFQTLGWRASGRTYPALTGACPTFCTRVEPHRLDDTTPSLLFLKLAILSFLHSPIPNLFKDTNRQSQWQQHILPAALSLILSRGASLMSQLMLQRTMPSPPQNSLKLRRVCLRSSVGSLIPFLKFKADEFRCLGFGGFQTCQERHDWQHQGTKVFDMRTLIDGGLTECRKSVTDSSPHQLSQRLSKILF